MAAVLVAAVGLVVDVWLPGIFQEVAVAAVVLMLYVSTSRRARAKYNAPGENARATMQGVRPASTAKDASVAEVQRLKQTRPERLGDMAFFVQEAKDAGDCVVKPSSHCGDPTGAERLPRAVQQPQQQPPIEAEVKPKTEAAIREAHVEHAQVKPEVALANIMMNLPPELSPPAAVLAAPAAPAPAPAPAAPAAPSPVEAKTWPKLMPMKIDAQHVVGELSQVRHKHKPVKKRLLLNDRPAPKFDPLDPVYQSLPDILFVNPVSVLSL